MTTGNVSESDLNLPPRSVELDQDLVELLDLLIEVIVSEDKHALIISGFVSCDQIGQGSKE